jgi:hypothetical protein
VPADNIDADAGHGVFLSQEEGIVAAVAADIEGMAAVHLRPWNVSAQTEQFRQRVVVEELAGLQVGRFDAVREVEFVPPRLQRPEKRYEFVGWHRGFDERYVGVHELTFSSDRR